VRVLLIDADIVAYQAAAKHQTKNPFGEGVSVNEEAALAEVDGTIGWLKRKLFAEHVIICLSDPERNFRKELNPSYKANRAGFEKPILLGMLKDHLAASYDSYVRPTLEADDVMGILATNKTLQAKMGWSDVIMVSEDKDMRTIPGKLFNPNRAELGIIDVSEKDALKFRLWQAVVGDPTDGYLGCPGVGPKNEWVEALLEEDDPLEMWDCVLCAYRSRGLSEEDAILQVRMSTILKSWDWDWSTSQVRPFETPYLLV